MQSTIDIIWQMLNYGFNCGDVVIKLKYFMLFPILFYVFVKLVKK